MPSPRSWHALPRSAPERRLQIWYLQGGSGSEPVAVLLKALELVNRSPSLLAAALGGKKAGFKFLCWEQDQARCLLFTRRMATALVFLRWSICCMQAACTRLVGQNYRRNSAGLWPWCKPPAEN